MDVEEETDAVSAILERMHARLDAIESTLKRIEKSAKNMDTHISFVERFMNPFRAVGGLMRLR